MKLIIAVVAVSMLTACSSFKVKSAFESGWNNETNETAYMECGQTRIKKGMFIQANLNRLVSLGMLTQEQANRARETDVRPGDPECLAYAAYGLNRKEIGITKNIDGLVTDKYAAYSCVESDVTCPGIRIHFSDGKVNAISAFK